MTQANVLAQLGSTSGPTFRNRIINGAMVIDQRNNGASFTPITGSNSYSLDRWYFGLSASSKLTTQQNAGSVTPPAGFTNYLGVTSSSAYTLLSSDYFQVNQNIEGYNIADLGWGTANAKTVTLSFWVYSSLTGTFGGSLTNNGSISYVFTYSIPVANTWTQISITIAGPTTSTWNVTNGTGVYVRFGLGVGSTGSSSTIGSWISGNYTSATGAVSVVGTNGATFYITGVQLEVGSSATGFEYRQYQQELALCQRYYTQAIRGSYPSSVGMIAYANNAAVCSCSFPVTMRTTPTVAIYSNGTINSVYQTSNASLISATPAQTWWTTTGIFGIQPSGTPFTAGQGYGFDYTANAEL